MSGPADFSAVDGLHWTNDGQAALSGPLLDLIERIDRRFVEWARHFGATEQRHPPLVSAQALGRVDYLGSFPHLATLAVNLDADPANLAAFKNAPLDPHGGVALTRTSPVTHVLCPAACYPVYIQLQGQALATRRLVTVRSTCFRREASYRPLERQWSFTMREIVCIGTEDEVDAFLSEAQRMVDDFLAGLGLSLPWQKATDPFFEPMRNSRYIAQRLVPLKTELIHDGHLAIGSINRHHDSFGRAYDLARGDGPAWSGCVAFGLERWVYMILHRFGTLPAAWPAL